METITKFPSGLFGYYSVNWNCSAINSFQDKQVGCVESWGWNLVGRNSLKFRILVNFRFFIDNFMDKKKS